MSKTERGLFYILFQKGELVVLCLFVLCLICLFSWHNIGYLLNWSVTSSGISRKDSDESFSFLALPFTIWVQFVSISSLSFLSCKSEWQKSPPCLSWPWRNTCEVSDTYKARALEPATEILILFQSINMILIVLLTLFLSSSVRVR